MAPVSVEHVFDRLFEALALPDWGGFSDAELVERVAACERLAARVAAHQAGAAGELAQRRTGELDTPQARWHTDAWAATAAELSVAMGVGQRRASRWMHIGIALRERLPRIAGLLADGRISPETAAVICWATRLLVDTDILAAVDAELAGYAARFGTLSVEQLKRRIGEVVARHDPDACQSWRQQARGRMARFRFFRDGSGLAGVYSIMWATDAQALQRRTETVAGTVCPDDPRTVEQRRADALGAIGAGRNALACACQDPHCPAKTNPAARCTNVTITVVAEPATVTTPRQRRIHGKKPGEAGAGDGDAVTVPPADPETTPPHPENPEPHPAVVPSPHTAPARAVLMGGHVLPAWLVAELVDAGAHVKPLKPPGLQPEPHYRPSPALAAYVRARDLTCRFFGCQVPADRCDIDHLIPWPAGPTHPANLACLCRAHHLLKTFYPGWRPTPHPDGVIEWTSPAGQTFTTHPGSHLLLPGADTHTPLPPGHRLATPPEPGPNHTLAMPRRHQPRAITHQRRIMAERAHNKAHRTQTGKPPPEPGRPGTRATR